MSNERSEAEEAIAKTLRLRATPVPVARISRRALIITTAIVSIGLFGAVSWSMLQHRRAAPPAADTPAIATPSERVTALPKGYIGPAGVPALGPPLPGDLGRPILAAQRAGTVEGAGQSSVVSASSVPPATPPPVDPEREARAAVRRAAGQSALFVSERAERGPGQATASSDGTAQPPQDPRTTSPERLQAPASAYVLQAGAVIPAALVTGLRSDAPGAAIAQVTQDVYDSLGGGYLLIPAGARLVGEYEAEVKAGQSRLRVGWTRLILPSGRSIVLDKLPAADAQGMAGLQDGVDRHGGRILAAAALSTLLAIGAESGSSSDESDLARAVRRGSADAVTDVGRQVVGRSLDRAPTLTIRPGAPLRVLLTRDLVLEPYSSGAGR
ncbi:MULTISPECIES: TrbI/VirB10 family protein [unclassified Caulobacter]|jgi:type IV secretion system protein VirB10|uniref:TrbI/VirB10 family protein n=1 Tax=unclassified Caulobacter TaxID=2648921 RepID=UPI000785AD42|nr:MULTISPECIES: TrbI/VirB10 family protein [unclassified Caulobacter]AZS21726.1 TrbI/VirB10 family protein [Caulobacter sp. FWC26]